jgi:electron transfer flavoprotein beta subunit
MSGKELNILVLLRETCDPRPPVRLNPDGYSIRERGLRRIVNPADLSALEQALRLAEQDGGSVTVAAVGPSRLDDVLRGGLALGATRAIRVWDGQLQGADASAAARVLGRVVEILAPDLVLTGSRCLDSGDDPAMALAAARFGMPCVSAAVELLRHDTGLEVLRKCDRGARQRIAASLPAAVLVEADSCEVRTPDQGALMAALVAESECWGRAELGLPVNEIGPAATLLPRGRCAFPRPNPQRVVTPDASLPAFERVLALLSGGLKAREGKVHNLAVEQTVEGLLRIFQAEGLLGEG